MLFNSYAFLAVFLPLVLAGAFLLRQTRHKLAFLVVASYVFYARAEWWFPALMLGSTGISFTCALVLERMRAGRRVVLGLGVAGCLSLLVVFKYAGLFGSELSRVVATLTGTGLPGLEELVNGIVLPAGISFFTFEAISYMVDVYRGTIEADRNPVRYALFISFFPHLIAGPIVRYGMLQPQLLRLPGFDVDRFRAGLLLVCVGLGKKVLVADGIAVKLDPVLANPAGLGLAEAWMAMVAYAFQIYLDFSAYSDMAIGLARMFGIELPWNFDSPYRAAGAREFWRRWHVTLSSWLRDYLYIPLGGSRRGALRRDGNVMATMGLGGLWHGASPHFVLWGLYHGALLVAENRLSRLPFRLPRFGAVGLTFALVTVGWVFFRLPTWGMIGDTLLAMSGARGLGSPLEALVPYLAAGGALMWWLPEAWRWRYEAWGQTRVVAVAVLMVAVLVSLNTTRTFLYFQF